jgi:ABC-type lipoprotein export system ATPase subunit
MVTTVGTRGLELGGVRFRYLDVAVLDGVDLAVDRGEVVAVIGRSGSGKSTLLHLAGALVAPETGTVTVAGQPLAGLTGRGRAELRRRHIGFVFQAFHLLAGLTVGENVALPLLLDGTDRGDALDRAGKSLADLGLHDLIDRRPSELSGGQQQRVAVARALVGRPALLLADEPTGNLDGASAADVLDAFLTAARARDAECVLVTHDATVAAAADRTLTLADGRLS